VVAGRAMPAALLMVSAILALLGSVVCADETPGAVEEVEVRIDTVLASNTGTSFDPALAQLRQPFVGLFPYSSYRLIQGEQRRIGWRREAEFLLPGGRYLVVIPRGYKDGRVQLSLMLIQGTRPLVNTALALKDNGVFLVAGPHYKEGVLIIAIAAATTLGTETATAAHTR